MTRTYDSPVSCVRLPYLLGMGLGPAAVDSIVDQSKSEIESAREENNDLKRENLALREEVENRPPPYRHPIQLLILPVPIALGVASLTEVLATLARGGNPNYALDLTLTGIGLIFAVWGLFDRYGSVRKPYGGELVLMFGIWSTLLGGIMGLFLAHVL